MKKLTGLLLAYFILAQFCQAQNHPFQNTKLSDDERLDNLISIMTLEEKIANLSSRPMGVPRLGVRGTRFMEGLHGLALSGAANWALKGPGSAPTTVFPQSIGLAQTWDTELLEQIAAWEAYECRYLAQNPNFMSAGLVILAPNADLGRDIRWGRTEECYGEDAFLSSRLTVSFVKGLQGDDPKYWKTASLMKHFLANSNENNRTINSSDFDERLFREYYSYPFYKGITEGGSRAFMAAYNRYNGIPCTVHPVLRNVAINEWGQNGIICTDGGAYRLLVTAQKYYPDMVEAVAGCIKAGISVFLDNYKSYLHEAIDKGMVSEKEIDQAVRGTLRVLLKLGLADYSPENPYINIGITDTVRPWTKPEAKELARKATRKSIVLLKNDKNLLPIQKNKIKSIAVIGPSANLVVPDWYTGKPPYKVSILDGITNALGDNIKIRFASGNKADSAINAAKESDIAIVCVGNHPLSYGLEWGQNYVPSDGREDVDRQAISLEQEDLVKLVKAANPNTVLVLVSSFPYAINWSKQNVPAILHVSQSSQELGNGVADILFGDESPSGRLVQTWSSSIDELLPILDYNIRNGRTYMYDKHEPLFAFGYGLSYTTFEYSNLSIDKQTIKDGDNINLSLNIKNTGKYNSDEVIQVYAGFPGSKIKRSDIALKGFKRIYVPAGQSIKVTITIKAEELKYWDIEKKSFQLEKGNIKLSVGAASNDLRLNGTLKVY